MNQFAKKLIQNVFVRIFAIVVLALFFFTIIFPSTNALLKGTELDSNRPTINYKQIEPKFRTININGKDYSLDGPPSGQFQNPPTDAAIIIEFLLAIIPLFLSSSLITIYSNGIAPKWIICFQCFLSCAIFFPIAAFDSTNFESLLNAVPAGSHAVLLTLVFSPPFFIVIFALLTFTTYVLQKYSVRKRSV